VDRLSDEDVDRIAERLAPLVIARVQAQHHEFWIDPERHYNAHRDMEQFGATYRTAQKIVLHTIVGLMAVGALLMAILGLGGMRLFK